VKHVRFTGHARLNGIGEKREKRMSAALSATTIRYVSKKQEKKI